MVGYGLINNFLQRWDERGVRAVDVDVSCPLSHRRFQKTSENNQTIAKLETDRISLNLPETQRHAQAVPLHSESDSLDPKHQPSAHPHGAPDTQTHSDHYYPEKLES